MIRIQYWLFVSCLFLSGCSTVNPMNPLRLLPGVNSKNYVPPAVTPEEGGAAALYHWFAICVFATAIAIQVFVGVTEKKFSKMAAWIFAGGAVVSVWASLQDTIDHYAPWALLGLLLAGTAFLAWKLYKANPPS
jgi:hypothetical protein